MRQADLHCARERKKKKSALEIFFFLFSPADNVLTKEQNCANCWRDFKQFLIPFFSKWGDGTRAEIDVAAAAAGRGVGAESPGSYGAAD